MFIRDYRMLESVQILSEDKDNKTMKIRGIFQRADEVNQNKRRYGKKVLSNMVESFSPMIKANRLCGELDHPSYEIVKLSNASHKITNLEMRGNDVIGEAVLLSTPAGQVAQSLVRDGVSIGISSRGTGSVTQGKDGISEVNEDFRGITFDLVADPSVHDAFPQLAEGRDPETTRKVESTIKKVYGEKIFLQLLESKLKETNQYDERGELGKDYDDAHKNQKKHTKDGPKQGTDGPPGKPKKDKQNQKPAKPGRQVESIIKRLKEMKWTDATRERLNKFYKDNPNYKKGSHGGLGGPRFDGKGNPQPGRTSTGRKKAGGVPKPKKTEEGHMKARPGSTAEAEMKMAMKAQKKAKKDRKNPNAKNTDYQKAEDMMRREKGLPKTEEGKDLGTFGTGHPSEWTKGTEKMHKKAMDSMKRKEILKKHGGPRWGGEKGRIHDKAPPNPNLKKKKTEEGLARTQRMVAAAEKAEKKGSKAKTKPAEKAILKQNARDRFRKVIKGNPNPMKSENTQLTFADTLRKKKQQKIDFDDVKRKKSNKKFLDKLDKENKYDLTDDEKNPSYLGKK
jgi:hypothetical protein